MKSKEIYQAIDLSKVGPELKTKLIALEKATDGFTNERADGNMDMAMNKIYAHLKDKKPESLKNIEVKTVEVEEKVETIVEGKPVKKTTKTKKKVAGKKKKVAKKTATPSSGLKKPTVSSVASKIRKPNESWSDALSRAKVIFNEKKQTQVAKTKKAVDDLRDFLKNDKDFKGWPRTYGKEKASDNSLERDAQRQASPPGKRVSKTGRVYYENRDNRSDREAKSFPRKIYLKEGGDIMIEPTILQNNPNYLVGTTSMSELFEKGGYVAVSEKDGYWYIMSKPSSKEEAQEVIDMGVPRGEKGKVVTIEEAKAYNKVIGREYLEKGGKISSSTTYVPNRSIKELSIMLGKSLKTLKGTDIVDGIYVKNDSLKSTKKSSLNSVDGIFDDIVSMATLQGLEDDIKVVKKDDIQKLLDAGYDSEDIMVIYFGPSALTNVKIDISYSSGLFGYREDYIPTAIENFVEAAKNKTYEIGLKYPQFNWSDILKKYNIDKSGKDVNGKERTSKISPANKEYYVYKIYEGDKVVVGTVMDRVRIVNGKKDDDDYYRRDPEDLKNFQGGYWGVVSSDKKIILDIAKMILRKNTGYVKDMDIFVNRLGGIDAETLDLNKIPYELGGEVVIPTTYLDYNPDYLVGTNTMYEMFAKGGNVYSSDDAYRVNVIMDGDVKETLIVRGRNKNEVRMIIEDVHEDKMEEKYGDDVMFEIIDTKGDGGKIGFEALSKKVSARYVAKRVAPEYQDEYGKTYSKEEADEVGDKVAAKVYRQQQQKMADGGFVAIYNGKKINIEADSLYAAKLKAIEEFKVPKSKQGLLSVVSNKSLANQDFRFMAKGGIMAKGGQIKSPYIVTFGFQGDDEYEIAKSKPIFAENEDEAAIMLKDQFESFEGIDCDIIRVKKMADGGSIPDGYHEMPDVSIMADSMHMAKGGYVDLQANLMKELQKLQRELNSQRLMQYTEGDDSQEEMARKRERASKLARFNEILATLRELESKKMANGGVIPYTKNFLKGMQSIKVNGLGGYMPGVRNIYWDKKDEKFYFKDFSGDYIFELRNGTVLKEIDSLLKKSKIELERMADGGMMAKGGKIREFDDVLIISKNKLGMVEAIADNIYYVTTPFGESFEAALDDLQKVKSFSKGGAMEHMILLGDKVLDIYKNVLIVQSVSGGVTVIDFRQEPIARRILVERITGKNTLASAKEFIDTDPSFNNYVSKEAIEIARLTATRPDAVQKFVDTHNLNIDKLYKFLKKENSKSRFGGFAMDFVTALVGRDGNPNQKKMIKMFQESVNQKMAMGGSLQGHGLEVGDLIVEDLGGYIRVVSEDGKDFFITLKTGDRETEAPLPFKHGGKVKHLDVTRLATKTNEAGDEVVDLTEFYEGGGNVPKVFDVPAQFLDAEGKRKNDKKTIKELTDFVLGLPQTKSIYYNDNLGGYTPSRKKLHAEIINKFKKEVVCINNDKPIAIFMGGSPASGKSTFLRKYSPFLLKEEILKIDADEIRAILPEYEGWNAAQTHLETRDIVNTLLSNKNIGIPCDFDIIYDGTMNSVKSYIPLMDILRKRGYKIFIVFMDNVPKDVIIKRALDRYKSSGRFVPLEVIEDFFTKGKSAFNELKKDVDGYMRIDGSSQDYKVLEEGGMKLPRDREYSKLGTKIKASDIPISYKKGGLSLLY